MTAVSFSISRGVSGTKLSDITVGTSAPGAGDIELRYNLTDTNSVNIKRLDIRLALDAFERAILSGNANVGDTTGPPL